MSRSDKALRSFFGARVGGQDRPQDVNTPQPLIDAILEMWPEGIFLDPCSNITTKVPAGLRIMGRKNPITKEMAFLSVPPLRGIVPLRNGGRGFTWPDFTYVNPPFSNLKEWMPLCGHDREHLFLAPVRPLRKWWCKYVHNASLGCYLYPFPFDGHKQMFPAPLVILYYGTRYTAFIKAFSPLGTIATFRTIT
jgi:hypothetical protein